MGECMELKEFSRQGTVPRASWRLGVTIIWLAFLGVTVFLWQLGDIGLIDETEPLFAEAARGMVETGDWLTPYFNEATRFDKPPLVYWLMAIGYSLLGFNEWAVRLPSALSAIALLGFCCYTLQRYCSWRAGWLGAAVLALNLQMAIWGRTGVSDMLLNACIGGTLLCFFCGYAKPDRHCQDPQDSQPYSQKWHWYPQNAWYWGAYVCSALAILTKGPVGLVLPGLIVLVFIVYTGQWRAVFGELGLPGGFLLLSAIALPWFIAIAHEHGSNYLETFFGYHNFERFTSVVNLHSAPWYFYFGVVLVGFAPWSAYLPFALAKQQIWRRRWLTRQPRHTHLGLFASCWFAVIFLFFTIAVTKLPSYTLPLLPAAALLIALALEPADATRASDSAPRSDLGLHISAWFNVAIALVFAIVLWFGPGWIGYDPADPNLGERLARSGLPQRASLIWLLATVGTAIIVLWRPPHWQRGLLAPSLVAFLAFAWLFISPTYILLDEARQLHLRQLAAIASKTVRPNERIVMVGWRL
ncbi:MAG: glycosyltransferase family 39 protein [Cyanobacteria bacterium J06641_5]